MRNAEVRFERGEAIVTYEKGAVTIEQMNKAVAQNSFTATLKPPTPRQGLFANRSECRTRPRYEGGGAESRHRFV